MRAIVASTLAAVRSGDQTAAKVRIMDLETACDGAQGQLKPIDATAWTYLDDQIDVALTAVRAPEPDPVDEDKALTDLLTALVRSPPDRPATSLESSTAAPTKGAHEAMNDGSEATDPDGISTSSTADPEPTVSMAQTPAVATPARRSRSRLLAWAAVGAGVLGVAAAVFLSGLVLGKSFGEGHEKHDGHRVEQTHSGGSAGKSVGDEADDDDHPGPSGQ